MNNKLKKEDCSFAKDLLLEEIQDGYFGSAELELFLSKHEECRKELSSFYQDWKGLGEIEIPEPSGRMDALFYKELSAFQATSNIEIDRGGEIGKVKRLNLNRYRRGLKQFGIAASIFIAGVITSFYILKQDNNAALLVKNQSANESIVYAGYNENESSHERLSSISELKKAPKLNDKIIEALNKALVNDPNINVRLSAIEAMLHYSDHPKVREKLIQAIPYQDSPIIQLTLAEVMIELEGVDSRKEWEVLLGSDNVETDVQNQLRETLEPVLKL